MMTPAQKLAKAKEILSNCHSDEDYDIAVGLAREAAAEGDSDASKLLKQLSRQEAQAQAYELNHSETSEKKTLKHYLELAKRGDTDAMLQLGWYYHSQSNEEGHMQKSAYWWLKAHEEGSVEATHNLGCYHLDFGDPARGEQYLRLSSAAGYTDSYYPLAKYYLSHADKKGYLKKGIAALTNAAESDNVEAQWDLACHYHDGRFVKQNNDKARYWLNACLASGYPKAYFGVGMSLYLGDLYKQNYKKALEYTKKAVVQGVHEADHLYIQMRWMGNGVEVDHDEVLNVYTQLAECGDVEAMFTLYCLYNDKNYELCDEVKALRYLRQAAKLGHPKALFSLGWCYQHGSGTRPNIHKAIDLYNSAMKAGEMQAALKLACIYITGADGEMEADCDKAIDILQPLLDEETGEAEYLMGYALYTKSHEKNAFSWDLAVEAFEHTKRAAEAGYLDAMGSLAQFYIEGFGVIMPREDETKHWLQMYIDNGGTIENESNPFELSEEDWKDYATKVKYISMCRLVKANIERLEAPLPMTDADNCLIIDNINLNAAKLGNKTALFTLGLAGHELLRTDPDRARRFVKAACAGGLLTAAYCAGRELLNDWNCRKKDLREAMSYFNLGAQAGDVECIFQVGLIYTDSRYKGSKRTVETGKEHLQYVLETDDEDYEELRQKARKRLADLAEREQPIGRKILKAIEGLCKEDA